MREYNIGAREIGVYEYTADGKEKSFPIYIKGVFRTGNELSEVALASRISALEKQYAQMTDNSNWGEVTMDSKVLKLPRLAEKFISLPGKGEVFLLQIVCGRHQDLSGDDYNDLQNGAAGIIKAAVGRFDPESFAKDSREEGSLAWSRDMSGSDTKAPKESAPDKDKASYDRRPPKPNEKESASAYCERISTQWSELASTCRRLEAQNAKLIKEAEAYKADVEFREKEKQREKELAALRAKVSSMERTEQFFNTGLDVMSQGDGGREFKEKVFEIINRVINSGREAAKIEGGE